MGCERCDVGGLKRISPMQMRHSDEGAWEIRELVVTPSEEYAYHLGSDVLTLRVQPARFKWPDYPSRFVGPSMWDFERLLSHFRDYAAKQTKATVVAAVHGAYAVYEHDRRRCEWCAQNGIVSN